MKNVLRKSNFVSGILILVVVCVGIVLAGDVIVKEGVVEGEKFKSTSCTAEGTKAVAFGYETEASGDYSTAMGRLTTASYPFSTAMGVLTTANGYCSTAMGGYTTTSGWGSTAMGGWTTASGSCSTAMGHQTTASGDYGSTAIGYFTTASGYDSTAMGAFTTAGPARHTTAIGTYFTNDVESSFAVGFDQKDFSVVSGLVTVGDVGTNDANLYVTGWISGEDLIDRSSFYDKDTYGRALDYLVDSSKTMKLDAEGEKEYNHEADPEFVQRWITLKDYDTYTEEEVWDELLNQTITRRIYQTRQELGSSVTMKLSWLTQCVFELKKENQMLKAELAKLKAAVGIE